MMEKAAQQRVAQEWKKKTNEQHNVICGRLSSQNMLRNQSVMGVAYVFEIKIP